MISNPSMSGQDDMKERTTLFSLVQGRFSLTTIQLHDPLQRLHSRIIVDLVFVASLELKLHTIQAAAGVVLVLGGSSPFACQISISGCMGFKSLSASRSKSLPTLMK